MARYNHRVVSWGKGRQKAQNQRDDIMRKSHRAVASFGSGGREPRAKKGEESLAVGKGKEAESPLEVKKSCGQLEFGPVKFILDF